MTRKNVQRELNVSSVIYFFSLICLSIYVILFMLNKYLIIIF